MGADAGSDWVSARLTREHTPSSSWNTIVPMDDGGEEREEHTVAAAAPLVSWRIFLASPHTPGHLPAESYE